MIFPLAAMVSMMTRFAGTMSYGQVSDYLVNWYIQEIIAPNEVVEEKFDPFDEDVVFATVPPTEETQGEEE